MSSQSAPIRADKCACDQVGPDEWQLSCELAAAHRPVAHFVFVDMTYNHLSARAPEEPKHFLVKPGTGLHGAGHCVESRQMRC